MVGRTTLADLSEIVIDSHHPAGLARFWAAVLTDYEVRAYDVAEFERLRGLGLTPETDPSVALDGPGPTLFFQHTDAPKTGRNRVHLDLKVVDREREVERLAAMGATLQDTHLHHSVMLDPEGNEFCVREESAT